MTNRSERPADRRFSPLSGGPIGRMLHWLLLLVGWTLLLVFFRASVRDRHRMPRRGPALVVSNHRSFLDPVAVHMVTNRRMRYLMAEEFFYDERFRWFYEFIGCIPVGDRHPGEQALDRAARLLDDGAVVSIFPEGRVTGDGRMSPFRRGAAMLAFRTGVPVVPVFVAGTHEALPKGRWLPRPRKIRVLVGEPLHPDRLGDTKAPKEQIDRLTRTLQERVATLGRSLLGDGPATRLPRSAAPERAGSA